MSHYSVIGISQWFAVSEAWNGMKLSSCDRRTSRGAGWGARRIPARRTVAEPGRGLYVVGLAGLEKPEVFPLSLPFPFPETPGHARSGAIGGAPRGESRRPLARPGPPGLDGGRLLAVGASDDDHDDRATQRGPSGRGARPRECPEVPPARCARGCHDEWGERGSRSVARVWDVWPGPSPRGGCSWGVVGSPLVPLSRMRKGSARLVVTSGTRARANGRDVACVMGQCRG